jgi:hypothetical protein
MARLASQLCDRNPVVDSAELQLLLDDIFDQGLVFHGFTDYMRDYELIAYCTADPRTGIRPTHRRYLFKYCVQALIGTAVPEEVWADSLDEELVEPAVPTLDSTGYVWGVRWQMLYPGPKVVEDLEPARRWSAALAIDFHEVDIFTNGHNINLVFSDLQVTEVDEGYSPFTVGPPGPDFKTPLP